MAWLTVRRLSYLFTRADWEGCIACGQPEREYVVHTRDGLIGTRLCAKHAAQLVVDREVVELVRVAPAA